MTDTTTIVTAEAARFARLAEPYLAARPISANVVASVLAQTLAGVFTPTPRDRWVVASRDDTVVGVAMANAPYNVFVPATSAEVARVVAAALDAEGLDLSGVTGTREAAGAFADWWAAHHDIHPVLQIGHHAYVLDTLVEPRAAHGEAHAATAEDAPLVAQWLRAFHDEALAHDPVVDDLAVAHHRIAAGEVWVWERDGAVASMAACGAAVHGVARVGPVYTPPAERGRGAAAGTVAAAVRDAFTRGAERVMLYADRANPTSNALYQRLGFTLHHDADDLGFRST